MKIFKKFWPADLNIEGKDQFRGWWNSQLILSEIRFGKKPFRNIVVHGMILDMGKIKMSKSKGNIISPHEIIEKYGRDSLRYYFAKISKGEDFAFDEKEFDDIQRTFRVLLNVNNFVNQLTRGKNQIKIEDKWILSKYNSLIKDIEKNYNEFKYPEAVQQFEKFIVEDLSKTYIKIVRDRSEETHNLLNEIRNNLIVMLSPIIPYMTEHLYRNFSKESVHLSSWPKADAKKIDKKLEAEFENALRVIEKGLAERDKRGIGLKWPLSEATVFYHKKFDKSVDEIIKQQLNVKSLKFREADEKDWKVEFNTKMTDELEAEGYARELSRQIQEFRKKLGLKKENMVETYIITDDKFKKILDKCEKLFKGKDKFKET